MRVELGDLLAAAKEEAVAELHDVRLVDGRHLPPPLPRSVVEGELGDPGGIQGLPERLHHNHHHHHH